MLSTPVASSAAATIKTIISSQILTKQSFAKTKPLTTQKFYGFCLPRLLQKFETIDGEMKKYPLLGLSHLLQVPNKSILSDLEKVIPMLLVSLDFPDRDLKESTLSTLAVLDPKLFVKDIGVIDKILKATLKDIGNDAMVRVLALKVLARFPNNIEFSILFPFKKVVLKVLGQVLDDSKRVVRRECANTRAKWFLLTGPSQ